MLGDEGRPALTFNKILPQVLTLSGLQRANRLDIKALPRGSSDADSADLMSSLLKYVEDRSNGDYEQTTIFEDGLITGLGCGEVIRSYDDDLEGELIFRALDPLQVFPDWQSRRADWDDARFCFKAPWKDPEELALAFPDDRQRILDMAMRMRSDDWLTTFGVDRMLSGDPGQEAGMGEAFYDSKQKKVRVLECYYRTSRRVPVVIAPNGDMTAIESNSGQAAREEADRLAKAVGGESDVRTIKTVKIATILGWEELQHIDSPFPTRRFPLVPYMPLFFRRHPWGLVRHLKDPQREINKRRSQVLHHLNTTAHSGWINHATEGADANELRKFGSKPGVVVNYQSIAPEQITPHPLAQGFVQLDALADRDMKEIGVPGDIMGQHSQRFISGRAMQARQFGAQLQTVRYFDQLRLTRKLLGELLVSIIPRVLSERRIREIVDQEAARSPEGQFGRIKATAQADPSPIVVGANGTARDPVRDLIERARKLRFDIVVEDNPALPTHRQASFQQLVQIGAMFPGAIPPSLLIRHTDLPDRDEILLQMEEMEARLGQAGLTQLAQQGRRSANVSEQLDVGDAGQQAQLLAGGQEATSEG